MACPAPSPRTLAERPGGAPLDAAELARMRSFVHDTRVAVFVRRADRMLLIRPEKTLGLNETAVDILEALYDPGAGPVEQTIEVLAARWQVPPARMLRDAAELLGAVAALLRDDFSERPMLKREPFDRTRLGFPTLAEIALTYDCQNRCTFCYASSPHRRSEHRLMSTAEVEQVMDRIFHEAHVPSLSFTGGEATLRSDLPELVRHGARTGFRMNLITNGVRLADQARCRVLVEAGLASAQISLEAGAAERHDRIVGKQGAFARTVQAVRNLKELGIHVHTNSTLCGANLADAADIVRFVGRELGQRLLSMNMVIRTGEARAHPGVDVRYAEVAAALPALLEVARAEGVKLVWYSPLPYCIFNPVLHGLGAKACACVDGILSVNPAGELLPCSSFGAGLGSLLRSSWTELRGSRAGRYWRDKLFAPTPCASCPDVDLCAGACPLYWDAAGSFAELPRAGADDARAYQRWRASRRKGASFGVEPAAATGGGPRQAEASWAP